MQGRQNAGNSERKGPHKSMHCKFCKPPGVVTPEKPTRPQLETKTKIHLVHEAADLRLCDVHDEPGVPHVDAEACVCVLEGENPCPKCVPDKNRAALKKKTCRCPKGAKPNPNMNDGAAPKKKKQEEVDDEFWWEKYSREHDAIARETWAAYMAQRRKDKKLAKCQKREQEELMAKKNKESPVWYQKLSCQQMIYVEFLSTAIRLDSDENITDRTLFVLGGLGLYPRPSRKFIKKCLRYCHYNSVQFLNQLSLFAKNEDFFNERIITSSPVASPNSYTWNERLIMNAVCHLEFPALLRELMDRLPELPREPVLPKIPYPVYPKLPKKKYDNPYEEPIWQERVNWVEKIKIDRRNRCRANMDKKRVKIPPLALVKRPSLIDARPPFLVQIEANEQAARRIQKQEDKKLTKKHPVSTFNSSLDMTAVAGIEASEISTTDKADTDDICVFLREPYREPELEEEDDLCLEKEVRFEEGCGGIESEVVVTTQIDRLKACLESGDGIESDEAGDVPFRTPPKTESGVTIEKPCSTPKPSPGPPAIHYDVAKRELGVINEELCRFHPFVSTTSTQAVDPNAYKNEDEVALQLMCAAEKLKTYAEAEVTVKEEKSSKKKRRKLTKKCMCKKNKKSSDSNKKKTSGKISKRSKEKPQDNGQKQGAGDQETVPDAPFDNMSQPEEVLEEDDLLLALPSAAKKEKKLSRKASIISDPDPHSDDEWAARRPCIRDAPETEPKTLPKKTRPKKRSVRTAKKGKTRKAHRKAKEEDSKKSPETEDPTGEHGQRQEKEDRETMTECHPSQFDYLYGDQGKQKPGAVKVQKAPERGTVFEGNIGPVLSTIIRDLAEEGFVSASYQGVARHPDINQLVQYLRGEILTKSKRDELHVMTKMRWAKMNDVTKFVIPELGMSSQQIKMATWKDKGWISRLAKAKKDEFYFKIASARAEYGRELFKTLYQNYFGTGRYLKIYYAYMLPKYEEAILRGVF